MCCRNIDRSAFVYAGPEPDGSDDIDDTVEIKADLDKELAEMTADALVDA